MNPEDVIASGRALNDVYIHALGTVDNYAWAIRHYFGNDELKRLRQIEVGLFKRDFRSNSTVSDFGDIAAAFADWHNEIKTRRDPVAHRIPLSVPPYVLNEDDEPAYRAFERS